MLWDQDLPNTCVPPLQDTTCVPAKFMDLDPPPSLMPFPEAMELLRGYDLILQNGEECSRSGRDIMCLLPVQPSVVNP